MDSTTVISSWLTRNDFPDNMPSGTIVVDGTWYRNGTGLIYIQMEPELIYNAEQYLITNYKRYKYIFTFNQNILNRCPNAIFYIFGTTWIPKHVYEGIDVSKKQNKISSLTGGKNDLPGHKFRQALYNAQNSLSQDRFTWFVSKNFPVASINNNKTIECKSELFEEFQFSIIIENSQQPNYFTEKIIDCLITKTIPIYWGCPNISNFFNTNGWIILNSTDIEDFKRNLLILTPEYYSDYTSIIEYNYLKAREYSCLKNNFEAACKHITYKNIIPTIRWLNRPINY